MTNKYEENGPRWRIKEGEGYVDRVREKVYIEGKRRGEEKERHDREASQLETKSNIKNMHVS